MGPNLACGGGGTLQDSICHDSLLVDADFNYSEQVSLGIDMKRLLRISFKIYSFFQQVKVNKNNYTLAYSGHGAIGSFIASMVTSGAIDHKNRE